MITKEQIENLIKPKIDEEDLFQVEVSVNSSNKISVFIDGDKGVTIDQCMALSRFIEQNLNRDEEDYELDVSSAGLDLPLKVQRQYIKNIGRSVAIILRNGQKLTGKLVNANDDGINLEVEKNVVLEGKKRKQQITEIMPLKYSDIKSTKIVVSFR
ncbi:MAG: ribosome assembly cofactor RimP [Bacteroidales bacterium]|nr:ribosome assembly cofactor RimP [Bacteroidales bacterium]